MLVLFGLFDLNYPKLLMIRRVYIFIHKYTYNRQINDVIQQISVEYVRYFLLFLGRA